MAWNSTFPLGSVSVKANRAIGQANTTYIETTMGNSPIGTNTNITRDHFWNVGANEDGRHRFMNSPSFTVGGNPADPVVGTGMNAVWYLKVTNAIPQWFTKTDVASGSIIYQATPNFLSGTVSITSSFGNIVAVPANVYGEIIIWRTTQGRTTAQSGFFRSDASKVEAWGQYLGNEGSGATLNVKFGNGSDSSGLDIRAKNEAASGSNTWNYRITFRAI